MKIHIAQIVGIEELKIIVKQPVDYYSMQSVIDILSSMSDIEEYHPFAKLLNQISENIKTTADDTEL